MSEAVSNTTNSGITTPLTDLSTNSTKRKDESSETKASSSSTDLGKDEFLQLLVAQMQYQDPLNPQSDTDFISQLAQFSSLEQMQNLNSTNTNTQAFSLVGKEVVVTATDSLGNSKEVRGTVDFVTIKDGKAMLSIEGNLYEASKLTKVMDSYYAVQDYIPSAEKADLKFDKNKPLDLDFKIDLGSKGYEASSVAVAINGKAVDSKYLSYENGKVTISRDGLAAMELEPGTYNVTLVFNDVLSTQVSDKITLTVTNTAGESAGSDDKGTGTDGDNKETDKKDGE